MNVLDGMTGWRMIKINDLIKKFKQHVIQECKNPAFKHHKWFVKYHLEIVEQIALELCEKYECADKKLVEILVWLHDYGKILDSENQHEKTLTKGKEKLLELGFQGDYIEKLLSYIKLIDNYEEVDLEKAPVEAKIVASADAASHLAGPFYYYWVHENPDRSVEDLMKSSIDKATEEWDKKIVLPEVKEAFKQRQEVFLEQCGDIPDKFLD